MTTADAIRRAGSRQALAELVCRSVSSTYRWVPDMPQAVADRLRTVRPQWFRGVPR